MSACRSVAIDAPVQAFYNHLAMSSFLAGNSCYDVLDVTRNISENNCCFALLSGPNGELHLNDPCDVLGLGDTF